MIPINIEHYILASIAKYLSETLDNVIIPPMQKTIDKSLFEVHTPETKTIYDSTQWCMEVSVNILIQTAITDNIYEHKNNIGKIQNLLTNTILIYNYGDSSVIGCLQVIEPGQTLDFGQLNADIKVMQATVEIKYRLEGES